ncbi:sarcoplasmic reticulum histidine-rich calcium-binding protein-like isoform X2 [Perca flavescens]|uniref:sarcoplasmic reticulum histidine-rich calcium-binding protein-like isoform X2 n=1 Tax=Perca flavescens TaxID=8167 RepID=UPI00106E9EB1|nr:sarcoplasmic reticulum histidine-rich calcium-binding protein-like isoform X2 [Perca flavescens]
MAAVNRGHHHAGVLYIIERPAAEGFPEVLRILDDGDDEGDDPAEADVDIREEASFDNDEEANEDDEDDEETDDSDNWSVSSADSGYDSLEEEEEEEEEEDVGDGPGGHRGDDDDEYEFEFYDYVMNYRPPRLWDLPPQLQPLNGQPPQEPDQHQQPHQHQGGIREEDNCGEPTLSASCPLSSAKRSREQGDEEPDPAKRLRRSYEGSLREKENFKETTTSTSGLSSSTKRSREESDEEPDPAKRPRRSYEGSLREEETFLRNNCLNFCPQFLYKEEWGGIPGGLCRTDNPSENSWWLDFSL